MVLLEKMVMEKPPYYVFLAKELSHTSGDVSYNLNTNFKNDYDLRSKLSLHSTTHRKMVW